jgi:transcriptional regulator with XRE-family HTH domain
MKSGAETVMPFSVRRALTKLGADVSVARRRRAMAVRRVTEAAGISAGTLRRIEKGDPSVSLGALAMVLLSLGEISRLEGLIPPAEDHLGLALDIDRLPKRIVAGSKTEAL